MQPANPRCRPWSTIPAIHAMSENISSTPHLSPSSESTRTGAYVFRQSILNIDRLSLTFNISLPVGSPRKAKWTQRWENHMTQGSARELHGKSTLYPSRSIS